jgi:hypothetical protein
MNRIAPRPRPGVVFSPLTQALRRYRSRVQKSQADISRDCWLNESYVSRLFSGKRTTPPSLPVTPSWRAGLAPPPPSSSSRQRCCRARSSGRALR